MKPENAKETEVHYTRRQLLHMSLASAFGTLAMMGQGCSSYKGVNYIGQGFLSSPTPHEGRLPEIYQVYPGETFAVPVTQYLDREKLSNGISLHASYQEGAVIIPARLYNEYCLIFTSNTLGKKTIDFMVNYSSGGMTDGKIQLEVIQESKRHNSYREAIDAHVYRTAGIVSHLIGTDGRRIIARPGDVYFIGRDIIEPVLVTLTPSGNHAESIMDRDYAGVRTIEDLFGNGSVRLFKDRYGIVHAVQNIGMGRVPGQLLKGDILAPAKPLGNGLENVGLCLENTLESICQSVNKSKEASARVSRTSDSINMAWIYFTKSFPLTGDGWRRVHSIVSPDGKLTLPIIGYMKVDEFPIHAGRKETIKDGIFVYDEVFAKTFNPDWAIRADKSAKTYETVGAIIADAGLILLICGSHNGGHHGGNNGQGSVPGGVDGSVPPDLPPGF